MHKLLADKMVASIRTRVAQGDNPTEPAVSVENLEDLVLTLASLPQQTAEPVIEAARELIASRSDTFRAGNNRRVGIQDQSGEKMWIVPFDEMAALERALEALND